METVKGAQAKKVLDDAAKLELLVNTPGWEDVLKPWLEARCLHAWEDPQHTEDKESFFYRYTVQWAKAEAAHQVLKKVEGTLQHAEAIVELEDKKRKQDEKDKS